MIKAKRIIVAAVAVAAFAATVPTAYAGDFDVSNSSSTVSNAPRPAPQQTRQRPTAVAAVRG